MLSIIFFLGLEKNETALQPKLQKPRRPSNKEKEEAVQFSIERKNGVSTIISRSYYNYCLLPEEEVTIK